MASLSEQLLALAQRADEDQALREALVADPGRALSDQKIELPAGVTARAEYNDGYGLYVELSGPSLGTPTSPAASPPASEQSTLDCLHV